LNTITKYVAIKTMALSGENTCLSFVSAVWRDTPILVMFNNLSGKVDSIMFDDRLQKDDAKIIEGLVKKFLT